MKKIYFLFLITFQILSAQNIESEWNSVYKKSLTEKVYLQLNNVLYTPGEIVYCKAFVTESDNKPSFFSNYLYIDILDGAGKKTASHVYSIENGSASGTYKIPESAGAGLYKIKAYTKMQHQVMDAVFEKSFFVQKVVSPRILMTLDFKKKAYGKGEVCEADFVLKNLESEPIKNYDFEYEVFIADSKIESLRGKTDDSGKAVVRFQLPNDLKSNDGIVNVMLDYDNFEESVTRSIPISLNFVDLQFLPESGYLAENENSSLFFIAKNEFGLPMDIAGFIEDENGNKITDFKSTHDGMGNVAVKTTATKKYFAVLTSPFQSEEKIALPQPQKDVFVVNAQKQAEKVVLNIYAPLASDAKILVRNTTAIHKTIRLNLKQGWNVLDVKTKDLPVGIQSFSLLVKDKIAAERLVFVNYQDGLKIEIKTDKEQYLPREKVKASILTKDKNNMPIASNLSVSVVDSKLLTYIDDKQDNILSWLLLGTELKGKIHEPRYYFDENKKLEEREKAIDLLLNTHGWRKYNQENLQNLIKLASNFKPEKRSTVEGFILNRKGKPVSVKILLFTDKGKVYETKSNSSGYFEFNNAHFSDLAYLAAGSKSRNDYSIKNSIMHEKEFAVMKDTLSNLVTKTTNYNYKPQKSVSIESGTVKGNTVSLNSENSTLSEVVVAGYGSIRKRDVTGSVVTIAPSQLTHALNGRAAGLQVTAASGQAGTADKIMIRGTSSIYGNRASGQPLIVVDGIPYANNENSSVFGSLPADAISSITILKDASAVSIYGSAAANGVIVVTTKYKLNQGRIFLGKKYHYTFQNISKSGNRKVNEAVNFYAPKYESTVVEEKTDFRSCLYWNSTIQTNNSGKADFEFYTSDDNTSFKILAEGTSYKGDLGKSETIFSIKEMIQSDVKIPVYVSQDDLVMLPVWLKNNSYKSITLECSAMLGKLKIDFKDSKTVLKPNESKTIYIPFTVDKVGQKQPLEITLTAENFKTKINKTIDVYAKGFPMNIDISGAKSQTKDFVISDPLAGSIEAGFKLFYNPLSSIFDSLEGMMREPYGCFEQVSSTNYPNIMAMQLLKYNNVSPEFKVKALKFLENGYQKLKNYESKNGGFEWYGGNPGNEALSAYGLLQFNEMKEFVNVDQKLIERTMKWMDSRKDSKGGFKQNPAKYGFSGIKYEVNNAYIVYVLSEIGGIDLEKQYQTALDEALRSNDLYRLNLMALASFNLKKTSEYKILMDIIKVAIKKNRCLKNLQAEQSVIHSYGKSMNIEIVSLYGLAILKEQKLTKELSDVLEFLQSNKTSYGFGSTQATALALKVIAEFTKINANTVLGTAEMTLNNTALDLTKKDLNGNVLLQNLNVNAGSNTISLQIPNESAIPYLFYVQYQTFKPNNSEECKLVLKTKPASNKVKISETARVEIEVQNKSNKELSNPIARIGIPGGVTPEPWQLKELVEKNSVDYYEIFGSELVLYFRKLDAGETRKINIDFKAIVPGKYKGISSCSYLYYENEHRNWNSGIEVEVTP